jgi:glycerol-3-phosphate acyltransferase PlsY
MPSQLATAPLLACLIAFLLGSVPFGLLIARIAHGGNLREQGSGNIGATNVSRVLGFWPWGAMTFGLDLLKGALPVFLVASDWTREWVAARLSGGSGWDVSLLDVWAVALFAVLGHCYSPWLKFRGGKGVATGFGVVLVLSPLAALVGLLAFAICFFSTRIGSLSSLTGLVAASAAYLVFNPLGAHVWMGAALILVILIRHEANINALLQNREKTFR